jgi:uncharacterized protein YbbK (DUF523 family)
MTDANSNSVTRSKEVLMCSACLLGFACRFDGRAKTDERLVSLADRVTLVPFCPEQMGGLPTPRPPAEERSGHVVTVNGEDITEQFEQGAAMSVDLAKMCGARRAVLRIKSPSCGVGMIPSGDFSGLLVPGDGVTARALKAAGVEVLVEPPADLLAS